MFYMLFLNNWIEPREITSKLSAENSPIKTLALTFFSSSPLNDCMNLNDYFHAHICITT